MKRTIYCISGLGADEQAFNKLQIKNYDLRFLPWIKPLNKKESLASYAKRLGELINEPSPILLGLSFGGMIAIEMAKQFPVDKIILVSSVKTRDELPLWMRATGKLKLHKFLPLKSNKLTEYFDNAQLGISNEEEKNMVKMYRKNADREHINWAIDQILNWQNNSVQATIFHIHGEKDRVFPLKRIKPTHLIKQATHIMVLNRASEISQCINQILEQSI